MTDLTKLSDADLCDAPEPEEKEAVYFEPLPTLSIEDLGNNDDEPIENWREE